jgi:hypothetical protein
MATNIDIARLSSHDTVICTSSNQLDLFRSKIFHKLRFVYIFWISVAKLAHLAIPKCIQAAINCNNQRMFWSARNRSDLRLCQLINRYLLLSNSKWVRFSSSCRHIYLLWLIYICHSTCATLSLLICSKRKQLIVLCECQSMISATGDLANPISLKPFNPLWILLSLAIPMTQLPFIILLLKPTPSV